MSAKVVSFIDRRLEPFSHATDGTMGEQWAAQSAPPIGVEMRAEPLPESTGPNLQPRVARSPRTRVAMPSPL